MNQDVMPADDPAESFVATPRPRGWLVVGVVAMVVVGTIGWYRASDATEPPRAIQAAMSDTLARAPSGVRIRVRVLNTTKTRGLAKRASAVLRDFGYDVVDYDSDAAGPSSKTRIVSHTGHDAWALRLRRALGVGGVEIRADSLRYVDFTVMIGSDWKPPAQPFRP
jgi:LytR cell envelope-related transcriptional attenuator